MNWVISANVMKSIVHDSVIFQRLFLSGQIADKEHFAAENYYRPQTKLRKGNVFTSKCQEFCPQGGCTPPGRQTPPGHTPPRAGHPPSRNGYCSRRYASYWNAFLLSRNSVTPFQAKLYYKTVNYFIVSKLNRWSG